MGFFKNAKEKEQNRRHLNLVYTAWLTGFQNNQRVMQNIIDIRQTKGHIATYYEIYNKLMSKTVRDFIIYLKNRYNVDNNTLEDIIGLKELTPQISSPGGYTQKQDFILAIHLIFVMSASDYTREQNDFVIGLIKGFNYTIHQIQFISDIAIPQFQKMYNYEEFSEIEENVYHRFIQENNNLPPISHG